MTFFTSPLAFNANKSKIHNSPLVLVKDLSFCIKGKEILKKVNLDVFPNEILTIIGPNGGGKSTLLKIILDLLQPTSGRVTLKPNLKVGYMPQRLHLSPLMPLTVQRFLELAFTPNFFKQTFGIFNSRYNAKILELTELLNVIHLLKSQMIDLSGGELQRVLFTRALLNEPELLVLDEPAQGVDVKGQTELYSKINDIKDRFNCATIIVSHDLFLVSSQSNKVVCLNKHICCTGYPESVYQHPEFIKLFAYPGADNLAIYTHKHDHSHDLNGGISKE